MRVTQAAAMAALLALCGCAPQESQPLPAASPFKIVATSKDVMNAITIPASDAVWAVPGEPPADDAGWQAVEHSALALAESGNLLLMPGRAIDEPQWTRAATDLIDTAMQAVAAARSKDVDALAAAGDEIYTVCEACHLEYMPQELPPE